MFQEVSIGRANSSFQERSICVLALLCAACLGNSTFQDQDAHVTCREEVMQLYQPT